MEITELDDNGVKLIAEFEGCVLHPYKDQVGIPTIGIGMTYYPGGKRVTMTDPHITIEQAYSMFKQLSKNYCHAVYAVTRDDITQNQFNALVSLTYNIGENAFKNSTVLKLVNKYVTGDQLKAAFLMWNKAGGKVLQDLVDRRIKEFNTYMTP